FDVPLALVQDLEAFSRHEGVTPFVTLLAAFQTLLHRYSGQEDICVGTPVSDRGRAELAHVTGFFVNTLVLRTDCSGSPSFRQLLARVQEVVHGALAHQDVPFDRLVEELRPPRDPSRNPLFQVMFEHHEGPAAPAAFGGLSLEPLRGHQETAMFDLLLTLESDAGGLSGRLEYNSDLFDADTVRRL